MIAISLKFPAGRYHATPWGRHVNEGAVEWPPAPWRILRALVAVWKRTLPELSQVQIEPILRILAGAPEFVLPPAATGHTRHFMPWFKKGPDDRTLVFDTFVAVSPSAPLVIRWPEAVLNEEQRQLLARVLGNLNRFGRSESWCDAALVDNSNSVPGFVSHPLDGDLAGEHEIVRLLCADPASAFAGDRVAPVMFKDPGRGKKKQDDTQRAPLYDPAWNFCMETLQLHRERWSDPPGSRWVAYARPRDCFRRERAPAPRRNRQPLVQVARYALDSSVLPLVTETLPVAEAARRALMAIYGRITEKDPIPGRSAMLSGKDAGGEPRRDHRHAYYLPSDEDGDDRLDHLTVYASAGFDREERRALAALGILHTGRESERRHPLRAMLLGMGAAIDYACGPLCECAEWSSVTPYLATRHAKTRGPHRIDLRSAAARTAFLENDVLTMAANQLAFSPSDGDTLQIESLCDSNDIFRISNRWRPIEFQRFRRKAGDDGGSRLAGAFRLRFSRPIQGPVALGFSSHFGMGLFMPAPLVES